MLKNIYQFSRSPTISAKKGIFNFIFPTMRYLTIAIAALLSVTSIGVGKVPTARTHDNCKTVKATDLSVELPPEWEGKEIAKCVF